jgi:hypothetical protein
MVCRARVTDSPGRAELDVADLIALFTRVHGETPIEAV